MNNSPDSQPHPNANGGPNGSAYVGSNGNGSLVPMQRPIAELLPQPVAPDMQKPSAVQQKALFAAFRRRWFLALSLGLLLGGTTTGLVWYLVPAPYSATAEIRILEEAPSWLDPTKEQQADFGTLKQRLMREIKGKFVLAEALRKPGISKLPTLVDKAYPVEWLEENLAVTSPALEYVAISLDGERPSDLSTIVNAVYESALKNIVEVEQQAGRARRKNLEDIRQTLEDKIRTKQTAMERLAEVLEAGDKEVLTLQQQLEIENLGLLRRHHAELQFELMKTKTELLVKQQQTPDLKTLKISAEQVDAILYRQPEIQQLMAAVQQSESLLSDTKARLSSTKNPIFEKYKARLDRHRSDLELKLNELRPRVEKEMLASLVKQTTASVTDLERKVELLEDQTKRLQSEMDVQKEVTKQRGIKSFELETLRKDIEHVEKVVDSLTAEMQRLDIELTAPPRMSGYQEAEIPHSPDLGKKQKLAGMAGFGVFGLIVAGIVWLEFSARRISSLDEVVDGLSLRILGSLPIMPGWMSKGKSRGRRSRDSVLRSVWTESIDATRTVLLRDARFESMKVVMICSAIGGEGKTTLSCHLATSLARSGRKTLLIDTDMRRCSLHKVFEVQQCPGFSELVRGEVTLDEAIQPLPTEGLYLLSAGKINQQTLKSLSGKGPESLFEQIKEEFDFVIVDSAPILPVNDSLLIGQYVDAILFSIRRDYSRFGKVATACERMAMLGVPLLGAVVVGLDESSYGYRYPYRYYAYGGYGYHVHSDAMR